jgi:hypothetical protein
MGQDLVLVNRKIPVENIEHFAFHPTNVPMLKNTGTPGPNDVFHHLVVEVFTGEHKSSDEDPFACPAFGGYP